jgi:hypothetical protein
MEVDDVLADEMVHLGGVTGLEVAVVIDTGAVAVGAEAREIADRRLRQSRHHAEHGQRKAELDIADAELLLQKREQHRQHEQMKMAEPMRDRDRRQRAQCAVGLRVLRCSQNVGHISLKTLLESPGRAVRKRGPNYRPRGLSVHERARMAASFLADWRPDAALNPGDIARPSRQISTS